MFRKFNKDGTFKITVYTFVSKKFPHHSIFDCWLEDFEGYMLTHVKTTKETELEQFDYLMGIYFGEGYSPLIKVYSTDGRLLYPKDF